MFSSRLPASLAPTPLAAAVAARRGRPGRLLDLTLSNPTAAGLAYPETLAAAWSNEAGLRYSPHARGLRSAREAVSAWYASTGEMVDPDALVLTASTSEAYAHLFKLLCDPGDEVLAPAPSYPLFEHLARLDGVGVGTYTFRDAGRWVLDEADLEVQVSSRTRAVIVVSPNNPTGHVPSRAEWQAMTAVCRRHGLALIVDEVFAPYPLSGDVDAIASTRPHRTGGTAPADDVLTFRLNGLSKLIGLPQAKLGWIVVDGPAAAMSHALDALDLIADTYLSVSTPVQVALPSLLREGAVVRAEIQRRLRANLAHVIGRLAGTALDVRRPDGGWSVVLRVPCVGDADDLPLALLARDVLVHPGYFYDLPHDGYVVVSLLTPERDMQDGLDVICSLPVLQEHA
ncbi:MAG TPA: pyridoxal phosphate-dependent aminotransferase [Luteitalea sp.]|nr:pyridoxal phosphate-dependent aminotransferase [Luteitalea sp.]